MAPDNAVEKFIDSSFIPAGSIEHNQHLRRAPRQQTALFIINPDRHRDPLRSVGNHQELPRDREIINPGAPRGGHLDTRSIGGEGHPEGNKGGLEPLESYEPRPDDLADDSPPQDSDAEERRRT